MVGTPISHAISCRLRIPAFIPAVRNPFELVQVQFFCATKPSLHNISDPYFRGYDMKNADYWLFKEWEREFDEYVNNGNLPNLQLVRLPHDHFGDFTAAIDGVNTPDTQMADNDYAVGLLVEKVSEKPLQRHNLDLQHRGRRSKRRRPCRRPPQHRIRGGALRQARGGGVEAI